MSDTKTINQKDGMTAISLAGIVVLVLVMLVAVLHASATIASQSAASLKGEVVAVNTYDRTLTVKPLEAQESASSADLLVFDLDKGTSVTSCAMNKTIQDIMIGEKVTVAYHEADGRLYADAIDIPTVILACYDE